MEADEDLRLAVSLGFFLLDVPGLPGGVDLERGLIRYDPTLPHAERAQLVCQAIRWALAPAREKISADDVTMT